MTQNVPLSRVILILSCGLVAISFSSIFTKMCSAPAMTIAFYRLGISSLLYFIISQKDGPLHRAFQRHHLKWAVLSGLALALHFATWISSLSFTSVSSSTVLVVTSPVWVALGSVIFLREKLPWLMGLGIVFTFAGSIIISGADFAVNPNALIGNLLAVAGAIFAAVYLIIGRKLRADISIFQYVTMVYGTAAIISLFFVLFFKAPLLGFDVTTWALLVGIALLPQVVGHTSFNWALKYFSATAVSIFSLGEPVGATLLAWLLLGEKVGIVQLLGGFIILLGVFIALKAEARRFQSS
jgi:drug/metabolite transporter (DMT)-like permease